MSKVNMGTYTMYSANEFCEELGWSMDELSFDGYEPKLVLASDVDECPYCVVRCDEQGKPMVLENGDVIDYTPHWYVFGAHNDQEISPDEIFDWLQSK